MKKTLFFVAMLVCLLDANNLKYEKLVKSLKIYAKEHPNDIKSREKLLQFYFIRNNKKMILKYSKELYTLNPNNKTLKKILNKINKKIKRDKVITILDIYIEQKKYIRYLNLYQAAINTNISLPQDYHIQALYSAIMSNNYNLAKTILKNEKLPKNSSLAKIMRILDRKLDNDISL